MRKKNHHSLQSIDYSTDGLVESDNLTKHEQRMLFIHLTDPESNSYNIPFCVQFHESVNVYENLSLVLKRVPILCTRFTAQSKATSDVPLVIEDLQANDVDVLAPFDLENGPLCRFAVDKEKNILKGSIHHSIADGRSMNVLFEAIATGHCKESTMGLTVRKYAALEASSEMKEKYTDSVEEWKEIMGDTLPRLAVDFTADHVVHTGDDVVSLSPSLVYNSTVTLDAVTVAGLRSLCQEKGVSMFTAALSILHHCLRAYSHDAFAVGIAHDVRPPQFADTVGMFVNTVLVPFEGGKEGGYERVEDLHRRWTNDILPHATTPYDMVSSMGYSCSVFLAFNVGLLNDRDLRVVGDTNVEEEMLYHDVDVNADSADRSLINNEDERRMSVSRRCH
eukprot:CAMPEP_0197841126 /NCGR_PEP_ID=MMETSP1437-20131217/45995_1 /TAXON_ID=49252 ORGANISM="Eucampia antarctica, Strain CCMP1452" /NCGR_SAMPLE_ID=MMETSP1437 /ASSEMBLY_ACC=CAM_ASM_001096 /LENGTH=391 /DNA_ID=CAMNT_0043450827 /DNA_START=94 /DNA_END=1266 /DNA_ORIENTATION=-